MEINSQYCTCLQQLFLVAVALAASAETPRATAQAMPGCPDLCGGLSIPFPFGTKEGCYLNKDFLITSLPLWLRRMHTISTLDLVDLRNETKFPVVLDWAIGNETCNDARKNQETYACKDNNSICYDSDNGPGYRCNCSEGYWGIHTLLMAAKM
ncbi:hypothetical protein GH714_022360 [Hevea brasiliensis]|uniref:Wall-associated receptor kinase galacturonan-binding domain-containing protein n=1 Tax=Hevea brasiliensis TaxID=3981 RepID=A0A6A6KQS2_HEVBR|nr:hypothetical protein GH714_022360 [Hevea brasiliensis]